MAPALVLTRTLKRARLAASVASPDELRLRALSLIQVMVASDRARTRLAQQVGEGHAGPTPLGPSLRNSFAYRRAQSLWGFFSWILYTVTSFDLGQKKSGLFFYGLFIVFYGFDLWFCFW